MNFKNNIFKYIVVALGILIISLLVILYFKNDDDNNKDLIKLNAPVVILTNDTAEWDIDDNAKRFEVSINGVLSYLDNTITSYKLESEETLKIRAIGDGISYCDSDWSNTVTYTNIQVEIYTINFYNYNGTTILKTINVEEGQDALYNGDIPTRTEDEFYSYSFIGWYTNIVDGDKVNLSNIASDLNVYARFSQTQKEYIVRFYDYNGELLKEETVLAGEAATAPDIPERSGFEFVGWYDAITDGNVVELNEILSNKDIYIRLKAISSEVFSVKFLGYNGELLKEETVLAGEAATAPDAPEVEGYEFIGWDKSYLFIAENIEINAEYLQLFYVSFIDYNNSVIKSEYVIDGENVVAPDSPVREGYEFIGWDKSFNNIKEDLVIKAIYERLLIVTFKNYDGTVIETQYIRKGGSAVEPDIGNIDYYEFIGWDKSIDNIMEDTVITAQYKIVEHSVTFVMPDGTIIGDVQYVGHNDFAQEPEYPEYYVSGGDNPNGAYKFTGWDKTFNQITKDTVVTAIYDTAIDNLVIILDFNEEDNSKANLYLLNSGYATLNAIEFTIEYTTTEGNLVINSVTVNDASPLWVEANDGTNDNQYVINNNTKEFTFAWSNAAGKQFNWCSKLLTFNFSTDGTDVSQSIFKVLEDCTAVVSDESGKNMIQILPLIIYC